MIKQTRQLVVAQAHGWDIRDITIKCVDVVPNTTYYLMDHGWSCGQCAARVTIGNFSKHARKHK